MRRGKAKLRVFYALHRRYRPGDYETWKYIAPIQKAAWTRKTFEYGTWGGEIRAEFEPKPGEIVATEHWCSSGFANTDLDLQLKKHGIHQLIVIGLIAHTCIEATVRFAAELGYEVTVVKDATADYSDKEMHAALDINIPNYASAIVTTNEIVELDVFCMTLTAGRGRDPRGHNEGRRRQEASIMSEQIDQERRRFLGTAAAIVAAAQLGLIRSANSQPGNAQSKQLPPINPGTNTSFGALKQINAGPLSIGYADVGPC